MTKKAVSFIFVLSLLLVASPPSAYTDCDSELAACESGCSGGAEICSVVGMWSCTIVGSAVAGTGGGCEWFGDSCEDDCQTTYDNCMDEQEDGLACG